MTLGEELGKKWLDVLAEDFEDTMPTFIDSDEEEEEETWNEWQEDNTEETGETVICLFCDSCFEEGNSLLSHLKETHHFDLRQVIKDNKMGFYDRVKFINFVRKMSHNCVCFSCGKDDLHSWVALRKHLSESDAHHFAKIPDRSQWDKEEFLVPTYENDNLLCFLDDMEEHRGDSSSGKNNAWQEKSNEPETVAVANVISEDPPDLSNSLLKDPAVLEELQ
ncbi:unnamed protein product [Soboliphyme baturini]|uniref:Zf-C2H2_2 domain-containing protein n=1 Tax=Soboliphyme baturini TaxID=241478 RepID=A0A183IGQ1_9BILA|nr:unnamed protein product [Soboliphyme baturini]